MKFVTVFLLAAFCSINVSATEKAESADPRIKFLTKNALCEIKRNGNFDGIPFGTGIKDDSILFINVFRFLSDGTMTATGGFFNKKENAITEEERPLVVGTWTFENEELIVTIEGLKSPPGTVSLRVNNKKETFIVLSSEAVVARLKACPK